MKEIKIKRFTRYFAIEDSIFAAIRYFNEKKSDNTCLVIATYEDDFLESEIDRNAIIDFLGYDFRRKKKRFERDCKMGGKLFSKPSVLMLYSQLIKVPNE